MEKYWQAYFSLNTWNKLFCIGNCSLPDWQDWILHKNDLKWRFFVKFRSHLTQVFGCSRPIKYTINRLLWRINSEYRNLTFSQHMHKFTRYSPAPLSCLCQSRTNISAGKCHFRPNICTKPLNSWRVNLFFFLFWLKSTTLFKNYSVHKAKSSPGESQTCMHGVDLRAGHR